MNMSPIFKSWFPLAVASAFLVLLVSVAVQQDYRQTANDPQIQMAEDAATALQGGASPQSLVPAQPVDIASSLAPFLIVTDTSGKVLASSATLNHASPRPPQGTLDAAQNGRENRLTWQPQSGVRIAAVIVRYCGNSPGYVVAGRNLREVENREHDLTLMSLLDLVGLLAVTFILTHAWRPTDGNITK